MRKVLWTFIYLAQLGEGSHLFAESALRISTRSSRSTQLVLGASSGLGTFQDVQVPMNDLLGIRGDGSAAKLENQTHGGLPIQASLDLGHAFNRQLNAAIGASVVHMSPTAGPPETNNASYKRFEARVGGRFAQDLVNGMLTPSLGLDLGFRKSLFWNVSSGHFISTPLVRATLGSQILQRKYAVEGSYLFAIGPEFGYSSDSLAGGKTLPGSQATLSEVSVAATWQMTRQTQLRLSFARETSKVSLVQLQQGYGSLGLNVLPLKEKTRLYQLTTDIATIGFERSF